MNLKSKFGNCIITQTLNIALLFERGTGLLTDRQTDNPIIRCPRRTFQAGGIKILFFQERTQKYYSVVKCNDILFLVGGLTHFNVMVTLKR